MKEVDLSGAKLDDEKAAILSTCLQNVEVLNVSKCELTTNGIQCIAEAIEQKSAQVLILYNSTGAIIVLCLEIKKKVFVAKRKNYCTFFYPFKLKKN